MALRYKEFWQAEHVFRGINSIWQTGSVFHQREDKIRGHVFCSFLALTLRKELLCRLQKTGHGLECSFIIQDLEAFQETVMKKTGVLRYGQISAVSVARYLRR